MKASGADLLPIDDGSFWGQDAAPPAPGVLHHLDLPIKLRFDPLHEVAFLVRAIHPDELETGEAGLECRQQEFAALVVLDIGFMDQDMQQ